MTSPDITDPIRNIVHSIHYWNEAYSAPDEVRAFARRRGPDIVVEPTEADWNAYRAVCDAVSRAAESDFIYVDVEIDPPAAHTMPGDYIETEEDWIARCKATIAEAGIPAKLDRVLSVADFGKLDLPTKDHRDARARSDSYRVGGLVRPVVVRDGTGSDEQRRALEHTVPTTEVIRDAVTFPRDRLGEPLDISPERFDAWLTQVRADAAQAAINGLIEKVAWEAPDVTSREHRIAAVIENWGTAYLASNYPKEKQ